MVSESTDIGEFPHFKDADVIISLTADPDDDLALHSSLLKIHSDFFRAGLCPLWKKNKITADKTPDGAEKYRYELEFNETTFYHHGGDCGMLVGKALLYHLELSPATFANMCCCWEDSECGGGFEAECQEAARQPLVWAETARCAETYGFLPLIASRLASLALDPQHTLSGLIPVFPNLFLAVACHLRSGPLFDEAFRHAACGCVTELRAPQRYSFVGEASMMEIVRLLSKHRSATGTKVMKVHNQLLSLKVEKSIEEKSAQAVFLAHSLWRQWVQETLLQQDMNFWNDDDAIDMPHTVALHRGAFGSVKEVNTFIDRHLCKDKKPIVEFDKADVSKILQTLFKKARGSLPALFPPGNESRFQHSSREYPTALYFPGCGHHRPWAALPVWPNYCPPEADGEDEPMSD